MKSFNTQGICIPEKHYMTDLSERVSKIKKYVDAGKYFAINCARQYGKTTTLNMLERTLQDQYLVVSLDFQDLEDGNYANGGEFSKALSRIILDAAQFDGLLIPQTIRERFRRLLERPAAEVKMDELFRIFRYWFAEESLPLVLIIDEVDTATNNQVFLDFLAQLRSLYLKREKNDKIRTFQSVILAGVTDVKHLRSAIREEDQHKVNSPWNIAADFTVDMSLSENEIKGMLAEYEKDHHTGMDIGQIAGQVFSYSSGYPFLVSRICQIMDESLVQSGFFSLSEVWTSYGVDEAVKRLLSEDNALFDSLMGKLENYRKLQSQLKDILLRGEIIEYLPDNDEQKQLRMYGFIVNDHNTVRISNKIFEMRLYKKFVGESRFSEQTRESAIDNMSLFSQDGWLNIPLIMEHFIESQRQIRNMMDDEAERRFIEEEGRERFLTYLSPIINGTGTYDIEPQTRNRHRMDVVVHYLGKRYVIELKIWRGRSYHEKGEQQICSYLDYWNLQTGYMLSFNFNKKKEPGVKRVQVGDRVLFEGTV